jgi:cytochrome c oxidase subunit 4
MTSDAHSLPHTSGGPQEREPPHGEALGTYWTIFFLLLALLAVTVGAYFLDLGARTGAGELLNTAIGLTIAVIKAALVVAFFMHVRKAGRLIWVFSTAAFLWLGLLIVLTMSDYVSRSPHRNDPQGNNALSNPAREGDALEHHGLGQPRMDQPAPAE